MGHDLFVLAKCAIHFHAYIWKAILFTMNARCGVLSVLLLFCKKAIVLLFVHRRYPELFMMDAMNGIDEAAQANNEYDLYLISVICLCDELIVLGKWVKGPLSMRTNLVGYCDAKVLAKVVP